MSSDHDMMKSGGGKLTIPGPISEYGSRPRNHDSRIPRPRPGARANMQTDRPTDGAADPETRGSQILDPGSDLGVQVPVSEPRLPNP